MVEPVLRSPWLAKIYGFSLRFTFCPSVAWLFGNSFAAIASFFRCLCLVHHRVYFMVHKVGAPLEAEAAARHEIQWSQSEEDITLRVLVDAGTTRR